MKSNVRAVSTYGVQCRLLTAESDSWARRLLQASGETLLIPAMYPALVTNSVPSDDVSSTPSSRSTDDHDQRGSRYALSFRPLYYTPSAERMNQMTQPLHRIETEFRYRRR